MAFFRFADYTTRERAGRKQYPPSSKDEDLDQQEEEKRGMNVFEGKPWPRLPERAVDDTSPEPGGARTQRQGSKYEYITS